MLTFAPSSNALGTVSITVTVNDGQPTNNLTTTTFNVTINQTVFAPNAITNVWIAPYSYFRFPIYPPYTNHDRLTYSLDPSAPAGVKIVNIRKSGSALVWSPSLNQASTTNIITIRIDNASNPILSTNQTLVVIVQDYLGVSPGSTSVQAGQNAVLPIYLVCSDGLTNISFSLGWPATRFSNPSLFIAVPGVASSGLQDRTTNLLINLQMSPGQVLRGSNLIAQLSFQTVPGQSSAFVSIPSQILSAAKPTGADYLDYYPQVGQVAVVNNVPLLAAGLANDNSPALTVYGQVGTKYQIQYSTNFNNSGIWSALLSYTQTNISQTFAPSPRNPSVLYRVQQQ